MNIFSWLKDAVPVINGAQSTNELEGKRLQYLIGNDNPVLKVEEKYIHEVSYDSGKVFVNDIAYCNLFDELNTGQYGPYLNTSDTAEQYNEGQIDPDGPGWEKNLREQFDRRKRQGFKYVELDNPDAYSIKAVLSAYDLAATYGFKVIAKNPEISDDEVAMLQHPAVTGVIVEKDCGTPQKADALRIAAGKPTLPVWFVCFKGGKTWGQKQAKDLKLNMFVSYSKDGEYTSSEDL